MSFFKKHRLAVVTTVYWVLLLYILAALLWWFIALNRQNNYMAEMRLTEINKEDPQYRHKTEIIKEEHTRKTAQYIGEGTAFLAFILIGAVFVYRATRRQFRLSQQQQNFMMAVTHELKTPIAVTRLNLETLQKRKLEPGKQDKLIANTLQEANRLNTLCNNILLTAQLEGGAYQSAKQEVNFSRLVLECGKDARSRYPQRDIQLAVCENIYLAGEELLLQMLVNNLVENALKYSPKDGMITIGLNEENKKVHLKVSDTGPGINDEEKKKVFGKFYRTGDENLRKTKGTGLGLYLCRKIVQDHKGQITITGNQPKGSIFTVTFNI